MAEDAPNRPPEGDWLGSQFLRFERKGSVAHLVVDRPEMRNAMSPAMYFGVRYAVDHVNADPDLAGLLITGSGDVFIPGGDLGGDPIDDWGGGLRNLGMDVVPFDAVRRSLKPVVCAVNGLCQGGGLVIAMLSDVAVASDRATFRVPELYRGIADTSYAQLLPRQVGPARARDLMYTGRTLDAETAVAWGLVARRAAHDDLMAEAEDALAWSCRTAPEARATVKRTFHEYYGHYDRIGMESSLGNEEAIEGFRAFKERRNPDWVPEDLRTDGRL
jgi:enoyl-CoA hydratase